MSGGAPSWSSAFDVLQAGRNLWTEFLGDWFRDPWAWPELRWLAGDGVARLFERIAGAECARAFPLDVPKENFATRPATILHPLDRMAYQVVVDRVSVNVAAHLPGFVCGWRLQREEPKPGVYANNSYEWANHRQHLQEFASGYEFALVTDIVSFFASVNPDRLIEVVERACRRSRARARLVAYLAAFEAATERAGIPQRSFASSLLANAYLRPLDELLQSRSQLVPRKTRRSTYSVVRWMDDIWLFGSDEGELRQSQTELEHALRELGLTMNTAKTTILSGDDLVDRARQREHSGVEAQLSNSAGEDIDGLEELVARVLAAPEHADRTTYRFILARVEEFGLAPIARQLFDVAHRAPHAADSIADAFRRLGLWKELVEWYMCYRESPWSVTLARAHFGRMFPRDEVPADGEIIEAFEEDALSLDLPTMTVALSRLVAWDSTRARQCLREAAGRMEHPLARRALALAALHADEEHAFVRKLLRSHNENLPLLELVESRGFEPFKLHAAF